MKTKKKLFVTAVLAILLVSLAASIVAPPASALKDEEDIEIEDLEEHWKILKTDIITVLFPRSGRKPMFLWWYTKEEPVQNIYVVKYQGLIEYFAFDKLPYPEFYRRMHVAWADRLYEMYIAQKEDEYSHMGEMGRLWLLQMLWREISEYWEDLHAPMLRFDAAVWELTDVSNITTSDGTVIGVTFAFKLVAVPFQPRFDFAVNNVMIKVRFYNTTVSETVPGTDISYTVQAGEMKMDLIINKWEWNIDTLRPLILKLREYGIDIPEGKTRLALWVNLASINLETLQVAEREPNEIETIEEHPEDLTTSHMDVEGVGHMSIEQNETSPEINEAEKPLIVTRPWWAPWLPLEKPIVRLTFATEDKKLLGFFRFVSSAKVTTPENVISKVPVRAAYIAAGRHLRLFLGYPYFGNGTLEHDPSIGVDVPGIDTTPQYTVQAPSGIYEITPTVIGKYVPPLFTPELAAVLVGAVSIVAVVIYIAKMKRKTLINMVGAR